MTPNEFSQQLFQIEPGSAESAELVGKLVDDARYPGRLARAYLYSADESRQIKARIVLLELGELALVPLAEGAPMPDVDDELWSIRLISEEFVDFRRRAASLLKDLLGNRRAAPGNSPLVASTWSSTPDWGRSTVP